MNILDCLKEGKDNAVTLDFICIHAKVTPRDARREMHKITASGEEIVCTDACGKGYYLAATYEEAKAYLNYTRSYWMSGLEKDRGIQKCMERKFSGQLSLESMIEGLGEDEK